MDKKIKKRPRQESFVEVKYDREDICLQTLLLFFKCANHRNKRPFVSSTNEALVGTLMPNINDHYHAPSAAIIIIMLGCI